MDDIDIKCLLEENHETWKVYLPPAFPFLKVVLDKGRSFEKGPFEGYGRRRRAKRCFDNSINLATEYGLRYVEGFGLFGADIEIKSRDEWWSPGKAVWRHAWCLDSGDKVVDPTWKYHEGNQYMGVIIDLGFAWQKVDETGYYAVMAGVAGDHVMAMCELYPEYKEQFWPFIAGNSRY